MPETWRYRGQSIDSQQVDFLREFIAAHPDSSRWKLSRQLCEVLGWKQANGALRDVVCRGLLLMLERQGVIELPPVRWHVRARTRCCSTRCRSKGPLPNCGRWRSSKYGARLTKGCSTALTTGAV